MTSGVKRTDKEMKNIIFSMGYSLLKDYSKDGSRRVIVEDSFGYKYDVSMASLVGGYVPEIVRYTNPFSLGNISLWIKVNDRPFELSKNQEYLKNSSSLNFICYECNEIFHSTWNQILGGAGCALCSGFQVGNKNNLKYLRPDLAKEWSSKNSIEAKDVTLHSGKIILWSCSKCGHEWKNRVAGRTSGSGCPSCAGQVLSDSNRLSLIFPELSYEWDFNKNGTLTPHDVSYGISKKVWWKCRKCNNEWIAPINNRTNVRSGCPKCANDKKESSIAISLKKFLKKERFYFICEYRILRNPKTNKYLPYDIYIPTKSVFIEIQGEQHYKINGYHKLRAKKMGTTPEEEFQYQKYKDKLKKNFAKRNGFYIEIDAREELDFEKIIKLIEK